MAITGPTGIQPNVRISGETPTTQGVSTETATPRSEATPSMATAQMQRAVSAGNNSQLVMPSAPSAIAREATPVPDGDFHAAMAPLVKLLNNPAFKTGMAVPGAAAFLAAIPTLGAIASAAYALWHFARFVATLMARGKLKWTELVKAGGHTAAAIASAAGAPLASTVAFLADAATDDEEEWADADGKPRKKHEPMIAPVPEPMA